MEKFFHFFAQKTSDMMGHGLTFALAVLLIFLWILSGPLLGFSDTWQLIINTTTTIITFLMVFLIQNTQNRDSKGVHIKLDELIKVLSKADDTIIDLDKLGDKQLKHLEDRYKKNCHKTDKKAKKKKK